jgi:hypothetical protein
MKLKKTPLATTLELTAGLTLVAVSTSCTPYDPVYAGRNYSATLPNGQSRTWTDPAYEAVKNSIPDTNYPATQIVGEWLEVSATLDRAWREKNYFKLRTDGTGQFRAVFTHNGKKWKEMTADLRWTYLGLNRWSIAVVPGSRRIPYVAPGFEGHSQSGWEARHVRFLPPRIYDLTFATSLVPLENEGLRRAIHEEQGGQ